MKVEGITWHAIALQADQFAATRTLMTETFGLEPMMEAEGWSLFGMPNGSILDLFAEEAVAGMCPWGLNDGVVFGFHVDDINVASEELAAAGCELLGDVNFIEQMNYYWRHFRGPDGRVYGLNQH